MLSHIKYLEVLHLMSVIPDIMVIKTITGSTDFNMFVTFMDVVIDLSIADLEQN